MNTTIHKMKLVLLFLEGTSYHPIIQNHFHDFLLKTSSLILAFEMRMKASFTDG